MVNHVNGTVCRNCRKRFEITSEDREFCQKIQVPLPTLCPGCRFQRRMAWRNERNLYRRKCDFSGESMISTIAPDQKFKVYSKEIWWSDQWDPLEYGQEYDFSQGRGFFEQFRELQLKVPRINMTLSHCENSDYGPYCVATKNVYLSNSCVDSEDLYYCYQTNHSRDCLDCSLCYHCELCYQSLYGVNLYHCFWTENCRESRDLWFCRDCQSCENCLGCANLEHKKFHIFNKPVSESEYWRVLGNLKTLEDFQKIEEEFRKFSETLPLRDNYNLQTENCTGDHLLKCKNAKHCFEAENLEDCAYVSTLPGGAKDTYDTNYSPNVELVYEAISATNNYNCQFISHSWDIKNSQYLDSCFYCEDCFGCVGLKKAKYCILNSQYSKEEYFELKARIIAQMKQYGEYGEFFPMELSPFPYEDTVANDYAKKNYPNDQIHSELSNSQKTKTKKPQEIKNSKTTQTNPTCQTCQKTYKIIPQENKFYQKYNLPIPNNCFNCRYQQRMENRSLMK